MRVPDISVVVPTHNRCRDVIELLTDIRNSCTDGIEVEVLVIASNCSDDTVHQCSSFFREAALNGRVKEVAESGVGKAKNVGLEEAASGIVLFLDDDMMLPGDFLRQYAKGIADFPEASVYGGRIIARWPYSKPWWYPAGEGRRVDGVVGNFDPLPISGYVMQPPFGGNMGVRIRDLKGLRFNPNLGMNRKVMGFGEESALVKELQTHGCRIAYLRDAVVYHKLQPKFCRLGYIVRRIYELNKALVALGFMPAAPVEASRQREAARVAATFANAFVRSIRERDTNSMFQWIEAVARRGPTLKRASGNGVRKTKI